MCHLTPLLVLERQTAQMRKHSFSPLIDRRKRVTLTHKSEWGIKDQKELFNLLLSQDELALKEQK